MRDFHVDAMRQLRASQGVRGRVTIADIVAVHRGRIMVLLGDVVVDGLGLFYKSMSECVVGDT